MTNEALMRELREMAEWADANEWEVPITLGDVLREAAERLSGEEHFPDPTKMIGKDANVSGKEERHGEWLNIQGGFWEIATCSCCQSKSPITGVRPLYCPNCGARMKGDCSNG